MSLPNATHALSRFTVLDLTRVRSGPSCTRYLADWGADVIRVEMPVSNDTGEGLGGPRNAGDYINLHRNKRSIAIDLKKPEGVALLKRMAEKADVLIENFRPDVKHRLGIDYETMQSVNPRLVYASISAFGQDGPYSDRPGFDAIAQGMGGLMSITGEPGKGPMRVSISIADLTAGMTCALGILVALLEREASGKGQWVQTSLLQAQISLLDYQAVRWLVDGEMPAQTGNDHPTASPSGLFKTKDGHINLVVASQRIWERFCHALQQPQWIDDPAFRKNSDRVQNRRALGVQIEEILASRGSKEWIEFFNAAGVPGGPVLSINEVFEDPQVQALGVVTSVDTPARGRVDLLSQPMTLSRTPSAVSRPSPGMGEHTDEILQQFGCSKSMISDLRERQVVASAAGE